VNSVSYTAAFVAGVLSITSPCVLPVIPLYVAYLMGSSDRTRDHQRTLIVNAQDGYGIYFFKSEHGGYGWAGADYNLAGKAFLRAIDYRTGKIAWEHPIGDGAGTAGVLTTASGLTISGDNRISVMALRTSDGATLWHENIGRVQNAPVTYQLDGKQYLIVGGGTSLYAFALP